MDTCAYTSSLTEDSVEESPETIALPSSKSALVDIVGSVLRMCTPRSAVVALAVLTDRGVEWGDKWSGQVPVERIARRSGLLRTATTRRLKLLVDRGVLSRTAIPGEASEWGLGPALEIEATEEQGYKRGHAWVQVLLGALSLGRGWPVQLRAQIILAAWTADWRTWRLSTASKTRTEERAFSALRDAGMVSDDGGYLITDAIVHGAPRRPRGEASPRAERLSPEKSLAESIAGRAERMAKRGGIQISDLRPHIRRWMTVAREKMAVFLEPRCIEPAAEFGLEWCITEASCAAQARHKLMTPGWVGRLIYQAGMATWERLSKLNAWTRLPSAPTFEAPPKKVRSRQDRSPPPYTGPDLSLRDRPGTVGGYATGWLGNCNLQGPCQELPGGFDQDVLLVSQSRPSESNSTSTALLENFSTTGSISGDLANEPEDPKLGAEIFEKIFAVLKAKPTTSRQVRPQAEDPKPSTLTDADWLAGALEKEQD